MSKSMVYWKLNLYFFFYFFANAACNSFFAIWLGQKIHLDGAQTGLIFSINAAFALIIQPLYGYISDRIGLKKHILTFISLLLIFVGPFFIYVYAPLLKINFFVGASIGGLYLGIIFLGGCGAIESYIEKVGRKYQFEFGKARMWGSLGSASAAFMAGQFFNINPSINFWIASATAIILVIIILLTKVEMSQEEVERADSVNLKSVINLFSMKDFWCFIIYVLGVACIYTVFDQQFPLYFASLFPAVEQGNQIFSYLNSLQVFLEAGMLFLAPFIVKKIGIKKALMVAGCIMSFRIIGSGLVVGPIGISFMKLIHAIELPIMIVAIFKYLASNFDTRLSSILYLVGYQFIMQVGTIVISPIVGRLYDDIGFKHTYLLMGIFVLVFTIVSALLLKNEKKVLKRNLKRIA
ncbi:MFS transporter [Priestia megaterium]|uniref:MFS transporter n=1 Tax=Priestia megaterium TaxID=1404 RepID=UPI00272FBED3|nr:MFS transporter [Priestia megaterium]MDP1442130.1 MFS transporter [Priestia megaterium]MDP1471093.1 MFS transporter [Priestia megaterium]